MTVSRSTKRMPPMARTDDEEMFDEEECGCCVFVVGSHYAELNCPEHGGGSSVVAMRDDEEAHDGK